MGTEMGFASYVKSLSLLEFLKRFNLCLAQLRRDLQILCAPKLLSLRQQTTSIVLIAKEMLRKSILLWFELIFFIKTVLQCQWCLWMWKLAFSISAHFFYNDCSSMSMVSVDVE